MHANRLRLGLIWLLSVLLLLETSVATTGSAVFDIHRRQQEQSVLEIINTTYGTLSEIISTAGLQEDLSGDGPFTVFAAGNDGFAAIPNFAYFMTDPSFLLQLRNLALFQVANAGPLTQTDLTHGISIVMMNGDTIDVFNQQGPTTMSTTDGAFSTVTAFDQMATNGVVHAIGPNALYPAFVFDDVLDVAGIFFRELIASVDGLEETVRSGNFTVLVPTSEASLDIPASDPVALEEFLKYHLIPGVFPSALLRNGSLQTMLGETVEVSVSDDGSNVTFNGIPAVKINMLANNGIVYEIASVLQQQVQSAGPSIAPTTVGEPSLMALISTDDSLSTFESAIIAAGLEDELNGRPPKTVFAPFGYSFDEFYNQIKGPEWIAHLQSFLQMHVSPTALTSTDLANGAPIKLEMLNDEFVEITTGTEGSIFITGPDGAGGAVIEPDMVARNGVLHTIDSILLPSFVDNDVVDVMTSDGRFSTILSWFSLAGLEDELRSGQYTVLAPTNDALNQLDPALIQVLTDPQNVDKLQKILEYHIVPKVLPSQLLPAENGPVSTLDGGTVVARQSESDGSIFFNDIPVVQKDILANNGLVHALGGILDASNIPAFTSVSVSPGVISSPAPIGPSGTVAPSPAPLGPSLGGGGEIGSGGGELNGGGVGAGEPQGTDTSTAFRPALSWCNVAVASLCVMMASAAVIQ